MTDNIYEILNRIEKKIDLLFMEKPLPEPSNFPYNVSNSKMTYPDASEKNFPDFIPDIVQVDGSFLFTLFPDGHTENSDRSRQEIRDYKNLENKRDWGYMEKVGKSYGFIFHDDLDPLNSIFFGQIHGETSSAIAKLDAGKGEFRALLALDEDGKNRETLKFGVTPVKGKHYAIDFHREFNHFEATLYDVYYNEEEKEYVKSDILGFVETDRLTRKDNQYTKSGLYGYGNMKATHFRVR